MNEERHGGRRGGGRGKRGHGGRDGEDHGDNGHDQNSHEQNSHEHDGRGGRGRHGHGPHGHHAHDGRGGGRRGGRLFDYGELRLLILALIANGPSHGYELIKTIEDRFAGAYSPSPGVIYPTLSWLEDMGYAEIDAQEGGRKLYRITPEGGAFLKLKKQEADGLFARAGQQGGPRSHAPVAILRAMENLKTALRLRMRQGPVEEKTVEAIAAAIDAAALQVEKCE